MVNEKLIKVSHKRRTLMCLDSRHFPFCICPNNIHGSKGSLSLVERAFFTRLFENRQPSSLSLDAANEKLVDDFHKGRPLLYLDSRHSLYFVCPTISMGQTVACHLLRGTLFYAVGAGRLPK